MSVALSNSAIAAARASELAGRAAPLPRRHVAIARRASDDAAGDDAADAADAAATMSTGGRARPLPRAQVEDLLRYAQSLNDLDRALIWGVYDRGMTVYAMSVVSRLAPQTLHRRLEMIVRHMTQPVFKFVHREIARGGLPRITRAIAERAVLQRRPQREVARDLGVTVHRVRREIDRLRILAERRRDDEEFERR